MQWELEIRAILTLPKVILWKIRYGDRLNMSLIQALDKGFVLRIFSKAYIKIGKEMVTRRNVTLRAEEGTLTIGDKCFLNNNVSITCMKEITIGAGCQIANNVVIVDHDHDYRKTLSSFTKEKIVIGNHVWIGANCVILKGTQIGDHCVIAAGSVVKGIIPSNSLYYQKKDTICRKIEQYEER